MEKKIPDSEIIDKLIYELRITKHALGKSLGYTNGTSIDHVQKGRNNMSEDLIGRIMGVYPQVNYEFLKTGEGSPLKTKLSEIEVNRKFFEPKATTLEDLLMIPDQLNRIEAKLTIITALLKKTGKPS